MNWIGVLLYLALGIAWSEGKPSRDASDDAPIKHEVGSIIVPLPKDSGDYRFFFNVDGKSYVKVLPGYHFSYWPTWDKANEGCQNVAEYLTEAGYRMAAWNGAKKLEGKLATWPMSKHFETWLDSNFGMALNRIDEMRGGNNRKTWMAKSESGECRYADEKRREVKEDKDCTAKLNGYICEFFYPKKSEGK